MAKTATKTTPKKMTEAHRKAIGRGVAKAAAKRRATPQETASNALSTSLADVARVVLVQFHSNRSEYSYYTRDESIKAGDYCIVISPFRDSNISDDRLGGFPTVVRVTSVKETVESVSAAKKWIIQKLDMDAVIADAERREQIKILKTKITKARKEAEERIKLEQLRELSPELSSLLDELDALNA